MSQIIKISNGEVTVKDFFSRGLKKKVDDILYEGIKMNSKGESDGYTMQSLEKSYDTVVIGMIEKATIDGKEAVVVDEKFIDNLAQNDFDKIHTEIRKITEKEIPKV